MSEPGARVTMGPPITPATGHPPITPVTADPPITPATPITAATGHPLVTPATPVTPITPSPAGALTTSPAVIPERRLHPAYLLIRAGRTGRSLIPVAAIALWRWPVWVLGVIAGIIVILSLGWWWQHRYQVADGYLRVRGGLIRRTSEAVPLSRVTALDARRGLIQRLFGVWELKVQVPGDGHRSAVVLSCLSSRRLTELRDALDPAGRVTAGRTSTAGQATAGQTSTAGQVTAGQTSTAGQATAGRTSTADQATTGQTSTADREPPATRDEATAVAGRDLNQATNRDPVQPDDSRASTAGAPAPRADPGAAHTDPRASAGNDRPSRIPGQPQPPEVVLARLDIRTLLAAAVTGTSVPLIIAGGFAAWNRARELLPEHTVDWAEHQLFSRGAMTVVILLVLFILAVVISVAITSLRLAGFTLIRQGDVLRIRRGLITQHSGTIVVDRVQAVRLVEGLWRRALGYSAIEVEVAGMAGAEAERLMFPLIRTIDAVGLIRSALPELEWADDPLHPAPRRTRRRYYTIPVCWAAGVTVLAVVLLPGWGPWLGVLPIGFALLVGHARATAAAWQCDRATVTLRWHRVFTRHTLIARRRRVQITRMTRSVWQRRAGLAGFHATLSTKRTGSIAHLDLTDAEHLQRVTGRRDRPASAC